MEVAGMAAVDTAAVDTAAVDTAAVDTREVAAAMAAGQAIPAAGAVTTTSTGTAGPSLLWGSGSTALGFTALAITAITPATRATTRVMARSTRPTQARLIFTRTAAASPTTPVRNFAPTFPPSRRTPRPTTKSTCW